jgi:hypothetical protein
MVSAARFQDSRSHYERLYRALLSRKGSPWLVSMMGAALADGAPTGMATATSSRIRGGQVPLRKAMIFLSKKLCA